MNFAKPEISVIIPCKNEEAHIVKCLQSIFKCLSHRNIEVIVVDSASSDRTVELAKSFPVKIVFLKRQWPLSPSAGRYHGVNVSRGKYALFIDGDMELLNNWIDIAIYRMESDKAIAGVRGIEYSHVVNGNTVYENIGLGLNKNLDMAKEESERPFLGGCAIFLRQAILDAGNFHPFLKAHEEYDISQRIRSLGYKLLFVPMPAFNHYYEYRQQSFYEVIRRFKSGLYYGIGQFLKLSIKRNTWRESLFSSTIKIPLLTVSWFLYACIISIWFHNEAIYSWLVLPIFILPITVSIKKGLKTPLALFDWLVMGISIIAGMVGSIPSPDRYPTNVDIVDMTDQSNQV